MESESEKIESCKKMCEHFVELSKKSEDNLLMKDIFFFKKSKSNLNEGEEEKKEVVDLNKLDDFELLFEVGRRKLKEFEKLATKTLSDENLNSYFFQASCEQRCELKYDKKIRDCIKNSNSLKNTNKCFKNSDF